MCVCVCVCVTLINFRKGNASKKERNHVPQGCVWIAFMGEIGVNVFWNIKGEPDTLSIRRLALGMILSLGSSKTPSIQAQKGQSRMNWNQHLHIYVKSVSPHL